MIKIKKIPTIEQLIEVSNSISNILKDIKKENMSIVFEVEKDILRQIDEEFYYKDKSKSDSKIEQPDEVRLNITDIVFKFKIKNVNN